MNLRFYASHGFAPTVLAVGSEYAGRISDARLENTVPQDMEVVRVAALPEWLTRYVGVTDLSLRAMGSLARAGDALIARGRIDLVFFSTTCFLTMQLGSRWLARFGVPFVLDYQDPWHAAPSSTLPHRRRGPKHDLMRALHARAEARTAPRAAGLIAVSDAYITALRCAYPALADVPADTIPFGHARSDIDAAAAAGTPWVPFHDGRPTIMYTGRVGVDMSASLGALFIALRGAAEAACSPLAQMGVGFLGTGYLSVGNPAAVMPHSEKVGISTRVVERSDRLPLFDALASLLAGDVLLVLGSDDLAYQPSKLHQLMAMRRPILCVAPSEGRLASQVRGLATVAFLPADREPDLATVRSLSARLDTLLALAPDDPAYDERDATAAHTSAESLAARECALFREALSFHARSRH